MPNTKKRRAANTYGHWAEWATALFLRLKGYTILTRRFKCPVGEIDIIAVRGNTLAMVEVKARKNPDTFELISPRQQQRISRAAALFIAKKPEFATFSIRFDAVIVLPWSLPRHITNAWQ